MYGQRIPREHRVHVAAANQFGEMFDAARVHHDRTGDDGDAAAGLLHFAHHRGDTRDAAFDASL